MSKKEIMDKKQNYAIKLRDPRWQKKRLEIFERDKWACTECQDTTTELQVHHKEYIFGRNPWEYDNSFLRTLCSTCHRKEHFGPSLPHQPVRPVENLLPFDDAEGRILKLLLMFGDLPIAPKYPLKNNKYTKLYEIIICEFVRFDIKFKAKELQQLYDMVASNYYNKPEFTPDIEEYLNDENEVIKAFARYSAESTSPLSPSWAKFGIFPGNKEEDSKHDAISLVFHFKVEKIRRLASEKRDQLKGLTLDEESMKILTELSELDKIKGEIINEKMYWL